MNKKGIALAVVLAVVAVLSVIIVSLFAKAIHENNLVKKHLNTVRAFWLAEAGISESLVALSNVGPIIEEQACPAGLVCSYRAEIEKVNKCAISLVDPGLSLSLEEENKETEPLLTEINYFFDASVNFPPEDGKLSLNSSILENASELYVSTKNQLPDAGDINEENQYYAVIYRIDGGVEDCQIADDGIGKAVYELDSVNVEEGYFKYGISNHSVQGSFIDEKEVKIVFVHQDLIVSLEDLTGSMKVDYEFYEYYQIDSVGKVVLPEGGEIKENIVAVMSVYVDAPPSSNFPYAIESTGDILIRGGAYTIDPEDSKKTHATLNFSELFGATRGDVKNSADYLYDETDNFTGDGVEVKGLTWVEVSPGEELTIAGNFEGEGILIVNGDCHISGTESFNGIIYVIGELRMSGNASVTGSILAESATDIDTTLSGSITITHDEIAIGDALGSVRHLGDKAIIAWQQK